MINMTREEKVNHIYENMKVDMDLMDSYARRHNIKILTGAVLDAARQEKMTFALTFNEIMEEDTYFAEAFYEFDMLFSVLSRYEEDNPVDPSNRNEYVEAINEGIGYVIESNETEARLAAERLKEEEERQKEATEFAEGSGLPEKYIPIAKAAYLEKNKEYREIKLKMVSLRAFYDTPAMGGEIYVYGLSEGQVKVRLAKMSGVVTTKVKNPATGRMINGYYLL